MRPIHEVATLTSKGQVSIPKSVRQRLGLHPGGEIAFDLQEGEVVVTRADSTHAEPAIGAFLSLLEADIREGRNISALPQDLARTLVANPGCGVDLDDDIEGEVSL